MSSFLLVLAAILFAFGGLFMKYSEGLTKSAPSLAVFVLFVAGAAAQALAMKQKDMGVAYIVVLGLEAVIAFGLSVTILGERASISRAGAIVLILAGIAWLERS